MRKCAKLLRIIINEVSMSYSQMLSKLANVEYVDTLVDEETFIKSILPYILKVESKCSYKGPLNAYSLIVLVYGLFDIPKTTVHALSKGNSAKIQRLGRFKRLIEKTIWRCILLESGFPKRYNGTEKERRTIIENYQLNILANISQTLEPERDYTPA